MHHGVGPFHVGQLHRCTCAIPTQVHGVRQSSVGYAHVIYYTLTTELVAVCTPKATRIHTHTHTHTTTPTPTPTQAYIYIYIHIYIYICIYILERGTISFCAKRRTVGLYGVLFLLLIRHYVNKYKYIYIVTYGGM